MTAALRRLARAITAAAVVGVTLPQAASLGQGPGQTTAPKPSPPPALLEAFALVGARDFAGARPLFERALADAQRQGDTAWEAEAHRGLAMVLYQERRLDECRDEMARAASLFEHLGDHRKVALVAEAMGNLAFDRGLRATAREDYRRALRSARAAVDPRHQASLSYNLCLTLGTSPDLDEVVEAGIRIARHLGSDRLAGQLHHCRGDAHFVQGRFAAALDDLQDAERLLERSGDEGRLPLARAWTSLGRLYRVHGRPGQAIAFYERALAVQERTSDFEGAAQSHNAIAVAQGILGRTREARTHFEQALERSRKSGDPSSVTFQTINLARWLIRDGEAERGVAMLEEVSAADVADLDNYQSARAYGYLKLGRYDRAEEAATAALAASAGEERRVQALSLRARAQRALGHGDLALADVREAVAQIERLRASTVPNDTMKLGFGDTFADVFSFAIDLLADRGLHAEALALAERGRARALADLLAARDRSAERGSAADEVPPAVSMRGSTAPSTPPRAGPAEPEGLDSPASTPPLTGAELAELAGRLRSVVVTYWVTADASFVWAVRPDGAIAGARIPVRQSRLEGLVRDVWTLPAAGAGANTAGAEAATVNASLRQLYRLLIEPIESKLPEGRGDRLTIVPHGPLFGLSFAALRDGLGRYLLERFTIHYGASGAVIRQSMRERAADRRAPGSYLLVADPASLPRAPDGQPLPPLPGTRREVAGVSRLLPASRVTVLAGSNATEPGVRRALPAGGFVHFATHGVVLDDRPQSSFLALSRSSATPSETTETQRGRVGVSIDEHDGRLTADEIYRLHLDADLVVMSACRTGLGQLSGDGMVGLARAFFVAGARTVVASLWDVADEPAARLMPRFYRARLAGADKSTALREAQLALLRGLRAGRVTVGTSRGPRALPELPVFWAGFVLMGEP